MAASSPLSIASTPLPPSTAPGIAPAAPATKSSDIPTENGKATGEYIDFLTGFVTPEGDVWGRPVGIAVAKDGALLVTDDGGECIWRVSYAGPKK